MNTFVGKFRTNVELANGIAIVAKNDPDTVLRTYSKKDEVLRTYENGIAYSWFIIGVDYDEVIYVNHKKWNRYETICGGVKDTIKVNPVVELYEEAKKQNVTLPESYFEALGTSLREIFRYPIFANSERTWSSASVFAKYKRVLRECEKTVNDFVDENKLDNFFTQLAAVYAFSEIHVLYDQEHVALSAETRSVLVQREYEFSKYKRIAFAVASENFAEHKWFSEWNKKYDFGGNEFIIKVCKKHVYLMIPHGKDYVKECIGWFEY